MSSKMPWFRAYTEMVDDEKLRLLAFEDRWHFVALLCLKGQGLIDEGGSLLMRKVAVKLGLSVREVEEVARRLAEVGLIDATTLQPLAWDNRQMKSDSSAERVKAYRERQKKVKTPEENNGNATGNGVCNVTVTAQEEDTDTDKEEEETVTSFKGRGGNSRPDAAPAATPPPPKAAKASKSSTATRLPDDWQLPQSWGQWAMAERQDLSADDVRREAQVFADYWHAKAGADARKLDWQATWRNWVRRADGRATTTRRGAGGQAIDPHAPVETYAQRAARQRMEEVAPMAARKAPGQRCGFAAAQAFMNGGDVIDVTPVHQQRIGG